MSRRRSVWSTRRYVRCHACGRIVLDRWARPTIADGTITAWTCRHCQPTRQNPTTAPETGQDGPPGT